MLTQAPKGTKDIYGLDMERWHAVEETIRRVCAAFGITEIRTPVFEHTELFTRSVGESTDVVQKEMYTFEDKGGRSITLRPEGTAGAARAFIEHGLFNDPAPVRLYYTEPMFRYEKMQAGRQRQFHQFGVELFGGYGAAMDAEAIAVAAAVLEAVGVKNVTLHINSLGGKECRANYNAALREYIGKHRDELCPLCRERAEKNPLRVLDCKEEKCHAVMAGAPSVLDSLGTECRAHFEELQERLTVMGIPFVVDPGIVRGLDYYTRTVFEFVSTSLGAQSTVCGGGRYDGLIEECGGPATGAVGFGMGLERLLLTLAAQGDDKPMAPKRHIYIGSIGKVGSIKAQGITLALRKQGLWADCDTIGRSVKAQMKYANKLGVRFTMILGDDELANGQGVLKNMETGETRTVPLADLAEALKEEGCVAWN
mgnify:CR=1 FL=1